MGFSYFVVRRLVFSVFTLLAVTILTFIVIKIAPGDPIDIALFRTGGSISKTARDAYRKQFGLDKAVHLQYFSWLNQLIHGNFGYRTKNLRPISEEIGHAAPKTIELMGVGLGLAVIIGVPIGILMAVRQYSILDYFLTVFAFVGVSVPQFFLAFFFVYVFSLRLPLLPIGGTITPGQPWYLLDHLRHLVIPSLSLAVAEFAATSRYARSSMLEKLHEDYVTTARAKGLVEGKVLIKHAFRTALSPIVTMLTLRFRDLIAGAVVIETVMQWPGMGKLFMDAVSSRDYMLLMSLALITGAALIVANFLADIAYGLLDPRVRYG